MILLISSFYPLYFIEVTIVLTGKGLCAAIWAPIHFSISAQQILEWALLV